MALNYSFSIPIAFLLLFNAFTKHKKYIFFFFSREVTMNVSRFLNSLPRIAMSHLCVILLHFNAPKNETSFRSFETRVCVMSQALEESIRFRSVTDAICIVLFTHFNYTVRDVMSMVEVVARRRCRGAIVKRGRSWAWGWAFARHALLKRIDTQIVAVWMKLLLILMLLVMMAVAVVGLCAPALRYPRSLRVWWVWRVVVGKMR